ncbi:MAG TPA: PEP/pyruvate-binding domain-containing protein, partial [Anaerolineales bacterium]|nr:PEP/pyruvate-binding domain-containing protein [Anaerolineales bacterium]
MSFVKMIAELDRTDLPIAGGKGANLGALTRAGLPVPGGFVVTTDGYRAFVAANKLDEDLRQILESVQMDDPVSLEAGSERIRARFHSGQIPSNLSDEIRRAYLALHNPATAVAVRSSATAEDLPDLSFAGQQDTYLNILGEASLLDAVVRCWASLWTARAIGYRARNAISHDDVTLAVVVQQMVQSEASGVLFTANPLTGKRTETVIDATLGLGEALVSGQVEPDHYVVETASGRILSKTLGAKALAIQGQAGGGTVTIEQDESQRQALPDEQIMMLTRLGQQAASHFGSPQDMEWAFADGQMYVVQSRPITSLYPLPAKVAAEPLEVLLSFGVWQGMLEPYTPLGQDMFSGLVSGMGRIFGAKIKPEAQRVFLEAGERLFVNLTGLLKTPTGRDVVEGFLASMDPISNAIVSKVSKEIHLPAPEPASLRNRLRLIVGFLPVLYGVLFNLLSPVRGRDRLERKIEEELRRAESSFRAAGTLSDLVDAIVLIPNRFPRELLSYLLPGVISGQIPIQVLIRLVENIPGGPNLTLELTRGLPHNVTTEMDLALWQTAQSIRVEAGTAAYFNETDIATLVSAYRSKSLPPSIQTAIAGFMAKYGMRGIGEVDLGRSRWNDDPTHIFQVLKNYLQLDPNNSPEAVFLGGAEQARLAGEQLIAKFRQTRGGKVKARLIKMMITRLRELGGLRETPKFTIVRL